MTTQIPHKLINEYPGLNFNNCSVEAIFIRDNSDATGWPVPYIFKTQPVFKPWFAKMPTNNVEGYIFNLLLTETGQIFLTGFEYPYYPYRHLQQASEQLTGDFTLIVTAEPFWKSYKMEFTNGVIDL